VEAVQEAAERWDRPLKNSDLRAEQKSDLRANSDLKIKDIINLRAENSALSATCSTLTATCSRCTQFTCFTGTKKYKY
jgi:hypothetical protein